MSSAKMGREKKVGTLEAKDLLDILPVGKR